jgi:hypothetical protein
MLADIADHAPACVSAGEAEANGASGAGEVPEAEGEAGEGQTRATHGQGHGHENVICSFAARISTVMR